MKQVRERRLLCKQCADIISLSYRIEAISNLKKGRCSFCKKKRLLSEYVIEGREKKRNDHDTASV